MEAAKDNEVDYEASEWENDENPMNEYAQKIDFAKKMQVEHGIYTKDGEVKSTHFHQEMDEQAKEDKYEKEKESLFEKIGDYELEAGSYDFTSQRQFLSNVMIQINKDVQDVNSSIKSKEKKLSSIDRVFNFDTQKFMTLCKKEESIKKNIDKLSRMSTSGSASEIPSKSLNKMPKQKQKVVDKITALIKILQAEVKKKATQSMSQLEKKNEKNMTKNNRFNSDASSDSESSERRRDSFSKGFKEETKEMHGSATYLHQDTISANKKSTSFNSDCSANESEEEYQKDQMCREISDPTKTVFEELRRLKKCIKKKGDMQPGSQPDKSAEAEELFRILTEKLEEVHHKDPLQNELASKLL